jgi:hypothetical protein
VRRSRALEARVRACTRAWLPRLACTCSDVPGVPCCGGVCVCVCVCVCVRARVHAIPCWSGHTRASAAAADRPPWCAPSVRAGIVDESNPYDKLQLTVTLPSNDPHYKVCVCVRV